MMIATERALDRMEPDTPPSERYSRLVDVGRARVLELRDPNEGQGGGPAAKTRHQYVRAGGLLWRRRLPPESMGEEWMDQPGPVPWEPLDSLPLSPHVLRDYWAEAGELRVALVRRQPMQAAGETVYQVRGETVSADEVPDVEIPAGPVTWAWWEVPLPPCPDCGGDLVWWEAGYVPGTRRCVGHPIRRDDDGAPVYDPESGCGSLYTVA